MSQKRMTQREKEEARYQRIKNSGNRSLDVFSDVFFVPNKSKKLKPIKKLSSKNKIKKITDDLDEKGIKWAFDHKLSSVFGSPPKN